MVLTRSAWPRGPAAACAPHNSALRIIPSHRNGAQRAFQVVGVDGDVWVAEEDLKSHATITRLSQYLGERIARQQPRSPAPPRRNRPHRRQELLHQRSDRSLSCAKPTPDATPPAQNGPNPVHNFKPAKLLHVRAGAHNRGVAKRNGYSKRSPGGVVRRRHQRDRRLCSSNQFDRF